MEDSFGRSRGNANFLNGRTGQRFPCIDSVFIFCHLPPPTFFWQYSESLFGSFYLFLYSYFYWYSTDVAILDFVIADTDWLSMSREARFYFGLTCDKQRRDRSVTREACLVSQGSATQEDRNTRRISRRQTYKKKHSHCWIA